MASSIDLRPITRSDVPAVAQFFHDHLNSRLSAAQWASVMIPPWPVDTPNHGFFLCSESGIAGAYLAFYSERVVADRTERFCNLAAFCVLPTYRTHALRLARAILGQRGYHFTDLSPSGNVIELNRRLGFRDFDPTTVLVANLPAPPARRARIVTDPELIEAALSGADLQIFRDHRRAAAAGHLLLTQGNEHCYIVVRKDRRKRLPLFVSVLHVGNPMLLQHCLGAFRSHVLARYRAVFTLAEPRVVGFRPRGRLLRRPRTKMFKSKLLDAADIDYLYSELTCVPW